jgi:NTE family protein
MTRALVLGGGGPVGIGWESGLAVGLAGAGVDVAAADAVFGTSAGSFVGAQLALGLDIAETVAQLAGTRGPILAVSDDASPMAVRMEALMAAIASAAMSDGPPEDTLRVLGRLALESEVPEEEQFLELFSLLEGREWPERFACTAVDTSTGEFVLWNAQSGAELRRCVASSCSVPCVYPPVTISGRRYMDGGMRSALNADVATGHGCVVVVSVMMLALPEGVTNPIFDAISGRIAEELATLESSGAEVEVIEPSSEFLEISGWGTALMDVTRAVPAYEAGIRQGSVEAARIGELWNR